MWSLNQTCIIKVWLCREHIIKEIAASIGYKKRIIENKARDRETKARKYPISVEVENGQVKTKGSVAKVNPKSKKGGDEKNNGREWERSGIGKGRDLKNFKWNRETY